MEEKNEMPSLLLHNIGTEGIWPQISKGSHPRHCLCPSRCKWFLIKTALSKVCILVHVPTCGSKSNNERQPPIRSSLKY